MSDKQSYYKEIAVSPSPEDPRRLVFIAEENAPPPPEDVVALRTAYDEGARVVRVLFADDLSTRKTLFEVMHNAADRGLRGPDFSIADGKSNLTDVLDTIVDQAISVRDKDTSKNGPVSDLPSMEPDGSWFRRGLVGAGSAFLAS